MCTGLHREQSAFAVQIGTLLPQRSYAFFSHTHKAQPENMGLLDEVLHKHVRLFDYELIVNDQGSRLVAFGEFAGRAGMVDFLRGLGERYLALGYSTPFLSLGSSYMYPSLAAAKAAVLAVGEVRGGGPNQALLPLKPSVHPRDAVLIRVHKSFFNLVL